MINERLCNTCDFFSPALTCVERPTWGRCMRLAKGQSVGKAPAGRALFTWVDNNCENYQPRGQPPRR
jgi:hypothetical protein